MNHIIALLLSSSLGMAWPASAVSSEETASNYAYLMDFKIKIFNDYEELLKRAIKSYIPYDPGDDGGLVTKEGEVNGLPWMHNIYLDMMEKHQKTYDLFYASIGEHEQCNFLLIKNNTAFLYTPYLKIAGFPEKVYSPYRFDELLHELEDQLFQEKDPQKVVEMVDRLRCFREAACEVETHTKPLPQEIVQSFTKITKALKHLQPEEKKVNAYELGIIYDCMWDGEEQAIWYYGLDSSIFGASVCFLTAPGSPSMNVARIWNGLIMYIQSKPANEQITLDWLKKEMSELPFTKNFR